MLFVCSYSASEYQWLCVRTYISHFDFDWECVLTVCTTFQGNLWLIIMHTINLGICSAKLCEKLLHLLFYILYTSTCSLCIYSCWVCVLEMWIVHVDPCKIEPTLQFDSLMTMHVYIYIASWQAISGMDNTDPTYVRIYWPQNGSNDNDTTLLHLVRRRLSSHSTVWQLHCDLANWV